MEQETRQQGKDRGTRDGEWHMEAKKAVTQVAAGAANRLSRRLSGWFRTRA